MTIALQFPDGAWLYFLVHGEMPPPEQRDLMLKYIQKGHANQPLPYHLCDVKTGFVRTGVCRISHRVTDEGAHISLEAEGEFTEHWLPR